MQTTALIIHEHVKLFSFQMSSTSHIGQLLSETLNENNFADIVTTDQLAFEIKVDCVRNFKKRTDTTFDAVTNLEKIFHSHAQDNVRLIALHIIRKTEDADFCVNLIFKSLSDSFGDLASMLKVLKFAESINLSSDFISRFWPEILAIVQRLNSEHLELSFLFQICSQIRLLTQKQFEDLEALAESLSDDGTETKEVIFLQIISQFRVDAVLPTEQATSPNVWKTVLYGLRHDQGHYRKRAIYLLKRLSDLCLKYEIDFPEAYSVGTELSNIIALFDTLEETQVHLIEPVFGKLQKVFEGFKSKLLRP